MAKIFGEATQKYSNCFLSPRRNEKTFFFVTTAVDLRRPLLYIYKRAKGTEQEKKGLLRRVA